MTAKKSDIKEFDNLSITDLMAVPSKELMIAIFLKIKQVNGKVRLHDKFVWAGITGGGLVIIVAIILGIINFCFA